MTTGLDNYWFGIMLVGFAISLAIKGSPIAKYWSRFLIALTILVFASLVAEHFRNPNAWCPPPRHVEVLDAKSDTRVCR